jgi:hypothetical protein
VWGFAWFGVFGRVGNTHHPEKVKKKHKTKRLVDIYTWFFTFGKAKQGVGEW